MKKVKIIFLCSLVLITSFLLFACKTKIKPTEVYFEETEIEMYLGKSKYLYPKLTPENANYYLFEWTTSNKEVATVSNRGRVTATGYGEATIMVAVKDTDITAECHITVNDGKLARIFVEENNFLQTEYFEGQYFDASELIVKGVFESGKSMTIPTEDCIINNQSPLTVDNNKITVQYQNFSTSFEVNVLEDYPISMQLEVPPNKTTYFIGETFDPNGMELILLYASGRQETIQSYNFSNEKLKYNTNSIEITYDEFKLVLPLTVKPSVIVNDLNSLQQAIDNAQDGESIMLREGTYNTTSTITISSSKNIIIFGENENTVLIAHNTPLFSIIDDGLQGEISLARMNLSVANNICPPISNPSDIDITLLEIVQ